MSKADELSELIDRQWERIQMLERLASWFVTGDVGNSSEFMAARFLGIARRCDYPHDVYDFGRCVELVRIVGVDPESVRGTHRVWSWLLDNWDEAVRHYQNGRDYEGFKYMMDRMPDEDEQIRRSIAEAVKP